MLSFCYNISQSHSIIRKALVCPSFPGYTLSICTHTCLTMFACACVCSIHTYIHTYIHPYMHACIHAYMHTCIHAYMHTCIHAYMHTCIHAYIHTYIHTYFEKPGPFLGETASTSSQARTLPHLSEPSHLRYCGRKGGSQVYARIDPTLSYCGERETAAFRDLEKTTACKLRLVSAL